MRFWIAVLAVVLALPLAVAAQQGYPQQPQQQQEKQKQVGTTGAVTVENIVDKPETYIGQTVTVSGNIGQVFNQRMFNIAEQGVVDVDDRLLVLWPKSTQRLSENAMVQVQGKVHKLNRQQIESEYNFTQWDVDDDFFTEHRDRPVLVATKVDVKQQRER